ncbi:hypothetical protein COCNU_01G019470 [Cocos nucifera]|uniref:Uncharacterized protein n=1 Tax=Cocos nucifera TaxID=13894 RepID=A0A8K0HXA8_COCNU|nr:hypothetical protein COCNU_01G019470 [Cocos nucifera]
MGKHKSAADEGSSRAAKKKRLDISMVAVAHQTDLPLIIAGLTDLHRSTFLPWLERQSLVALASIEDTLAGVPPVVIEEPDDDVVIVEAPIALAELIESRAPSIPKDRSEDQRPMVTQVAHDVSTLDKGFRAYADTRKKWSDQVAAIKAERVATHERLSAISDKEKEMEGWEKKLEENSHLKAELESAHVNLESVNNDLDLAHSKLGVVQSELVSVRASVSLS